MNTEKVYSFQQMQIAFYLDQLLETLRLYTVAFEKFVHRRS